MKGYVYFSLLLVVSLCVNCSGDDDFSTFSPKTINFVNSDGTFILENDCVNPNEQYSIAIDVNTVGAGPSQPTQIEYTINGALYSATFTNDGIKEIPITLQEGTNIAQLVNNGVSSTVYITTQDDFELVE